MPPFTFFASACHNTVAQLSLLHVQKTPGEINLNFLKGTYLPLLILILLQFFGCSRRDFESTNVLPEETDGVFIFRMNHVAQEKYFFGKWTAPRLGRNQQFFRSLQESGGGIRFFLLKKESALVDVEFYNQAMSLDIHINDQVHSISGGQFRMLVSAEHLRLGENIIRLTFPEEESVAIEQIRILPKGFLSLEREFDLEHDFLTPAKLVFHHNLEQDSELRLTFIFKDREPLEVKISAQSESNNRIYNRTLRSGESIRIPALAPSFHRIVVELPETRSRHVRLAESRFTQPKTKKPSLERLRSAVEGKNLLLILLDAARADHLSCHGYPRKTTPNIDALVDEGILFQDTLCEAAYTLASTGTLLTGLPPDMHGVVSAFFNTLADEVKTFPELAQEKGFFTAAISSNPYFGQKYNYNQGFEQFIELFLDNDVVDADEFVEPFKKLLAEKDERPFLIYLHLREPHYPYRMPAPFIGRYQEDISIPSEAYMQEMSRIYQGKIKDFSDFNRLTDAYDENLTFADHVTGQILDHLRAQDLFDETIVVITSDHGEALGEHKLIGHNHILYQEGIHIPLILRVPGFDGPEVISRPAMTSDLVVTFCELMEMKYPYPTQTLGKNLFALPEKRTRICRSLNSPSNFAGYAVASHPYKMLFFPREGGYDLQLFDLKSDAGEADPMDESEFPADALMSFLNTFIHRARQGIMTGKKPRLTDKEREALKALGYIK